MNNQFNEDIEQLGNMVEQEIRRTVPTRLPPLPHYVEHNPQVDDVGRLSAEALVMSYEASAKEIEAMGHSLISEMRETEKVTLKMVEECEKVKAETHAAVKECAAAAEIYRGQAKELFERIQARSIIAAEVRKTAADMINKVRGE